MLRNPTKKEALIALGANLPSQAGPPERTLALALERLAKRGLTVLQSSPFYRTPCFPKGNGPDYVNAAATLEVEMDASSLLAALHEVEVEFGRERVQRWGQRTLDLDLIALGDEVHPMQPPFPPGATCPWKTRRSARRKN